MRQNTIHKKIMIHETFISKLANVLISWKKASFSNLETCRSSNCSCFRLEQFKIPRDSWLWGPFKPQVRINLFLLLPFQATAEWEWPLRTWLATWNSKPEFTTGSAFLWPHLVVLGLSSSKQLGSISELSGSSWTCL